MRGYQLQYFTMI